MSFKLSGWGPILLFVCIIVLPYISHIWWSLSGLFTGDMDEMREFVIALLGAFIPPIGWVHGLYLWFS